MYLQQFIKACLEYNRQNNIDVEKLIKETGFCPVHIWASLNTDEQCMTFNSGTTECSVCRKPMCPVCGNHNVTQISRVTGYMSSISGWKRGNKS